MHSYALAWGVISFLLIQSVVDPPSRVWIVQRSYKTLWRNRARSTITTWRLAKDWGLKEKWYAGDKTIWRYFLTNEGIFSTDIPIKHMLQSCVFACDVQLVSLWLTVTSHQRCTTYHLASDVDDFSEDEAQQWLEMSRVIDQLLKTDQVFQIPDGVIDLLLVSFQWTFSRGCHYM